MVKGYLGSVIFTQPFDFPLGNALLPLPAPSPFKNAFKYLNLYPVRKASLSPFTLQLSFTFNSCTRSPTTRRMDRHCQRTTASLRTAMGSVVRSWRRGWKLLVSWKDNSTDWIPLKDLMELSPVEVVEYAVANKIAEEPAFAWWVRDVLRCWDWAIK